MRATWIVVLCACSSHDPPSTPQGSGTGSGSATPDVVRGTLTIAGKPETLGACKPGHAPATFVEVVGSTGTLHYESTKLSWNGEVLACAKLDRSWGGGTRLDGTSYWRGTLSFRCTGAPGEIAGDLTLDCGNITAAERAQLDANRKQMQDEQRAGSAAPP
ncbi:MAG TPA: hypothetical protein VFQ53_13825 [Kofleriaceae bacterium]|nr:hypothetical protein [Kofleriaceae bacterium]